MNVKILFDHEENEYLAFIPHCEYFGHGDTESRALLNLLYILVELDGFNQTTINFLIKKLEIEIEAEL